ncbi:uncharacterized protein BX663DRAFT_520941 [Cokeromyces recurvatus]|uniref:uncharacterized protein n=1 Tax=Cokeromyces recurvatus TaxID=90255 RepID=UPI00222021D9|nr:uncharacterized protein BX663DRAFT_520941 [Cokeromyces recurvatus]KAI7899443.1 hypothetical protein BX663DRAFT_520941 [Cokeromyces recurvatus]
MLNNIKRNDFDCFYFSLFISYSLFFIYLPKRTHTFIFFTLMTGFIIISNSGKKISLEHASHPCPRCKNPTSVQLTRSEKSLIVLNKRITDNSTVRYECSQCRWKNQMLPYDGRESAELHRYLSEHSAEDFFFGEASTPSSSSGASP